MRIKQLLVSLLAITIVFFVSCSNGTTDMVSGNEPSTSDNTEHAYIFVHLGEDSEARSVLPTALDRNELSYVLKGKKSTETAMSELGNWDSYTSLQSMSKIELTTGSWSFTLEGLKEGVVVLTSTITKTINYGNNSLSFTLKETTTGNGNLNVSLKYPLEGITKVTAGLFDLSGNAISAYSIQNISSTVSDGKNIAQYKKTAVPKGTYILRFYLYQKTSDLNYTNVYSVIVRVAPGCNTTGIEEIENLNSIYTITYYLNDGLWEDDIYIPLSYTNYTNIELPTTLYKEGYVFGGWYTDVDFSGEKVSTIPYGTDGNKTYYAKWIDEISCSAAEFLTIFEGYNNGSVTVHITDETPNLAVLKTGLKNTSVMIKLDLSACTSLSNISASAFGNCTNLKEIILPSSINVISEYAFINDINLNKIIIPNNVTSVGTGAFCGCTELSEVIIGESVSTIGFAAFENCSKLHEIIIPDSVTDLGANAFNNCTQLNKAVLGTGITTIPAYCFNGCRNLSDCTMSNNVENISDYSFTNCSQLQSLTLSNQLASIGLNSFDNCSKLSDIELPESLTKIDSNAFAKCITLSTIKIPDNVTTIGEYVFNGCNNIQITINNIILNSIAPSADSSSYENKLFAGCRNYTVNIVAGTNTIADYAFYNCRELKSIILPDTIIGIGNFAFYYCTGLTSIDLPANLTTLGNSAFANCSSFTLLTIPNKVTSIGNKVFSECKELRSLTLSNTLKTIGTYAFQSCSKLITITIPDTVTSIGEYAFIGDSNIEIVIKSSLLNSFAPTTDITNNTTYTNKLFSGCSNFSIVLSTASTTIATKAFAFVGSLKNITIPETVTSIGAYAFYKCTSLSSVSIPNSVTSIGNSAFYNCSSATSITLPNTIDNISNYLFYGCTNLVSMEIPGTVTSIGNYAYYKCSSLNSISLSTNITNIGEYAFYGCTGIEEFIIPKEVTTLGKNALCNLGEVTVTISGSLINAAAPTVKGSGYSKTISGGTKLISGSRVTIQLHEDTTTTLTAYAFYGYNGIVNVIVPNTYTSIGESAFSTCIDLESATISNAVKTISNQLFYNCSKLVSVNMGSNITTIGECAFFNCSQLTNITIPSSVTRVGIESFGNCPAKAMVPEGVTIQNNGAYSFGISSYDCSKGSSYYNSCTLQWYSAIGASSYKIYRYIKSGTTSASVSTIISSGTLIGTTTSTMLTDQRTPLPTTSLYTTIFYAVVPVNSDGQAMTNYAVSASILAKQ